MNILGWLFVTLVNLFIALFKALANKYVITLMLILLPFTRPLED